MMPTDTPKGEERIMYLCKGTEFPILDIVDFHINLERSLAKQARVRALDTMHVNFRVWSALREEVYKAKDERGVPDTELQLKSYWVEFKGMKLVPFFSTPSAEAAAPHASVIMFYRDGVMYGL